MPFEHHITTKVFSSPTDKKWDFYCEAMKASAFSNPLNALNKRILIYGAGELGQALYREFNNSPNFGIIPVGFIDDNPEKIGFSISPSGFNTSNGVSILGNRHDIKRLKETLKIDEVSVVSG